MPQKSTDGHLAGKGSLRRAAAEGGSGRRPPAVILALKIGNHDIGALRRLAAKQQQQCCRACHRF